MVRTLLTVIGLLTSFTLFARTDSDLIKNLQGRLYSLPNGKGQLIKSFTNHTQSYIYDQALAIIAFSKTGNKKNAASLLKGLKSLQHKDGSLYFSYYLDGQSPYPTEGDKRFAGAIAWVALAATHYQHQFKTDEFKDFNEDILKYLTLQMSSFTVRKENQRAIRFSPSDIGTTSWNEQGTVALEHNLDAYSAFLHFSTVNKTSQWKSEIKDLKQFILSMWDSSRSHFWSGVDVKTGLINKSELYLDNQSWSILALDKKTLSELNTTAALELNCEMFYVEHEGVIGFMDSKPTSRPATSKFVWSEGSAGQIMAMKRMKEPPTCQNNSPTKLLLSLKKMRRSDGGIGYATTTPNPDFTTASSVAGTAWYFFASNNINPFQLDDLE
jgi:hypothetical protein